MSFRSRSVSIPWTALLCSLLGLAWCGYVAFPSGNDPECLTSGCALFQDAAVAGVSLWWIGGACFFVLAVLCLRGRRYLAWLLARLALFLDCLLLGAMYFTAPCLDCLVAAAFFALTFWALRPTQEGWFDAHQPPRSLLLPVWFGLFLGNAALAANENIPAWTLANPENRQVRLYFSPSCPACREAVRAFGATAALLPVAENPGDTEAVLRMERYLAEGLEPAQALELALAPDVAAHRTGAGVRTMAALRLVRNKAAVLRQGYRSLPLLEVNGMPGMATPAHQEVRPALTPRAPAVPAPPQDALPWDLDNLSQCTQGTDAACDDAMPAGL